MEESVPPNAFSLRKDLGWGSHCSSIFLLYLPKQSIGTGFIKKAKEKLLFFFFFCMIALIPFFFSLLALSGGSDSSSYAYESPTKTEYHTTNKDLRYDALITAEYEVKRLLQYDPDSADFGGWMEGETRVQGVKKITDKLYSVENSFKAKNAYGTLVRARYKCTVTFPKGSDPFASCEVE